MTAKRPCPARRVPLGFCLLLGLVLAPLQTASAATFVVNALEDVGDANPGDGVCASALFGGTCTLRAAVQEANALPGTDTIQIPSFPITLVFTGSDDAALVGDLDLTDDVHIEGTGLTLLDRGTAERVFDVISGSASIRGVRFANGGIQVKAAASGSLRDSEFRDLTGTAVVNYGDFDLVDVAMVNVYLGIDNEGTLAARSLRILGSDIPDPFSFNFAPFDVSFGIVNLGRMILSDSLIAEMTPAGLRTAAVTNAGRLLMTNVVMMSNRNITLFSDFNLTNGKSCAGALYNKAGASARLIHVTFHGNEVVPTNNNGGLGTDPSCVVQLFVPDPAPSGGPNDVFNETGGSVEIGSSLLFRGEVPLQLVGYPHCEGIAPTSLGHNTSTESSNCMLASPGTDLTGGVTFSYPPDFYPEPSGANAIGSGPVGCPPQDARGHSRPNNSACDRGAVQVGGDFACQNGLDDDGDGLVDLLDPGCASATDPLEVDLSPGDILLTSVDLGLLFSVDPVSGRREIIAGGGGIAGPAGVVQTADGSIQVASLGIAGSAGGPLMRVDPETGEQTLVAWDESTLAGVTGIEELANGDIAATSPGIQEIAEIDPATGVVSTLATGPGDFDPRGISQDPTTGDLFVAASSGTDRLFEIVGGVAVPVALAGGATVGVPRDLVVADQIAYISDSDNSDELLRVDLVTGVVESITPLKTAPRGVEIEADGSVLVADRTANEITRVNPDTGAQDSFATGTQLDDAYFMDVVPGPEPCEWTRYADQARFEAALGAGAQVFDFSSVPLDGGGNAGISNGHDFGPFTWTSLSLSADIDLFGTTAPDGTLYVTNTILPPEVQGWPGATGAAGTPANDDDFRLDFATGQQAAGIEILDSRVEAGERVEFRDDQDAVIAAFELPGKNAGAAGGDTAGFVGLEVCPGTPLIRSIVVDEGATVGTPANDNIGFTNVVYLPEPGAMAMLGAGMLGLAALNAHRRRRSRCEPQRYEGACQ